jgi:ATP-binding cassette subfamily B protein/subfamily B ATP-binding cassette protein MsbA
MVFYGLLAGVSDPARKLSGIYGRLYMGAAAAQRVFSLMDREPSIQDPAQPRPLPQPHRELVFDNVRFSYQRGEPVLKDIRLRIPFGEKLALVGPNGCGKSTLVKLIPRFYDTNSGAVRLDGVDLREFSIRDWRRQIGLVTQETWLFDDTVMNNIRYGKPQASDEEVIEAARKAHAHEFITEKLEKGYRTIVGERGDRLSGGQRQRISLARAILRDPAILILDEATSEIDVQSEQFIHHALAEFSCGRTTIIITHRLSTLALVDRIAVMNRGRILDVGTHSELLARCKMYKRLRLTRLGEVA